MNRRKFLVASAGAALLATRRSDAAENDAIPEYQKPVFNLHKFFANPVRIASIDLLQSGKNFPGMDEAKATLDKLPKDASANLVPAKS